MKRSLMFGVLVVAALVLLVGAAYACGEKEKNAKKGDLNTDATLASSSDKGCPFSGAAGKAEENQVLRTISIKGMTSTGCEASISAALVEVPGVVQVVKVCHKSGEAVVEVNPAVAKDVELATAIANKGYEVEVVPAAAKSDDAKLKRSICPLSGSPACAKSKDKAGTEKSAEETR